MINILSSKRSFSLPQQQLLEAKQNENIDTFNTASPSTSNNDTFRVVIRVRPPLKREVEDGMPFRSIALISKDGKSCSLAEYMGYSSSELEKQKDWVENPHFFQLHQFTFDNAFDIDSSQKDVYEQTAKPAVLSVLEGYNSTIFAYGQTGTGKTFTMEGFTYSNTDEKRGIIPRSIEEIFNYIESFSNNNTKFMVRASYLQIYNENVSDLLRSQTCTLHIREDKKKGVFVEGLSEWAVRNPSDIYSLLQKGSSCRETSSTKMNDVSSRSHAVFVIIVEQMTTTSGQNKNDAGSQIKVGKLNLVDLAGSERIKSTGSTGKQLEEGKKINKSLSALGNVINALTDNKNKGHVPYRDSKLTRLLEDSLGGNCKTTMMAMISPSSEFFSESLSTLHFARRAKNIKNRPKVNEDIDHKTLIREYEIELKKLRIELEEKNRLIHSNELVLKLDEQRKRAEEDKKAAIVALEQASRQYIQEREEKKKLEHKIQLMNSQMITGGHKGDDSIHLNLLYEEKHSQLMKEFDNKVQEVEKEKQIIEEEKAQVERYKHLLLKQRDIMIALTSKLNERDEHIVQLQEVIEAYEKINKDLEENAETYNYNIEILEKFIMVNGLNLEELTLKKTKSNNNKVISRKNTNEKVYIPYNLDRNDKGFENAPTILLNSEEKIKELSDIIKEMEKEIEIMKLISSKIINNNINTDFLKSNNFLEFKELLIKNNTLEKEKLNLEKELKEKDLLRSIVKPRLENILHNIKMGINYDLKIIQNEVQSVYNEILASSGRSNFIDFEEEKHIKINFDLRKYEQIQSIQEIPLIKSNEDINTNPPITFVKTLPIKLRFNHIKEKLSKRKSVSPFRTNEYDKFDEQDKRNFHQRYSKKLTDNINVSFEILDNKSQGQNNHTSKSVMDRVDNNEINSFKNENSSLNSSGLIAGNKNIDLNKFKFNK